MGPTPLNDDDVHFGIACAAAYFLGKIAHHGAGESVTFLRSPEIYPHDPVFTDFRKIEISHTTLPLPFILVNSDPVPEAEHQRPRRFQLILGNSFLTASINSGGVR